MLEKSHVAVLDGVLGLFHRQPWPHEGVGLAPPADELVQVPQLQAAVSVTW